MKKIIAITLMTIMILASAIPAYAADSYEMSTYSLTSNGAYNLFTNYVDGYSLNVDASMTVDMSYSGVGAVLENSQKRIEIYKQSMVGTSQTGYINYSNKFLGNTADHYLEFSGYQKIGAYEPYITAWSRSKCSRVSNDMNYYLVMDIPSGGYVYTIYIKSALPISDMGGYVYLANNFTTFEPTTYAYNRTSEAVDVETRGWNDETKAFYNMYFSDEAYLTWGIFEPQTSIFDYNELSYYEDYFGYEFPIILNYSEFDNTYKHPNLKQRLDTAYSHNKTLELTLQTTWSSSGNMMYDILDGTYDEFLRDYAKVIAEFEHPVLFRPFNEMNGDWCPYSGYNTSRDTIIFKNVYKYIYGIFEEQEANNVIWVWNPNETSFPGFKWNETLAYYPGDEYVDVVGMTAYNTGNYYASVGEKWEEFADLYGGMYNNYCMLFNQPLMITEFASANRGGDKAQWIRNMFKQIQKYDRIKVAIWWDGCDWDADGNIARSYFIDESPEIMDVFKANLKKPWYVDSYA